MNNVNQVTLPSASKIFLEKYPSKYLPDDYDNKDNYINSTAKNLGLNKDFFDIDLYRRIEKESLFKHNINLYLESNI